MPHDDEPPQAPPPQWVRSGPNFGVGPFSGPQHGFLSTEPPAARPAPGLQPTPDPRLPRSYPSQPSPDEQYRKIRDLAAVAIVVAGAALILGMIAVIVALST